MRASKLRTTPLTAGPQRTSPSRRAFTLIEIMIVVGIRGIVMAMGVPAIYRVFHKESLRKAVNDIVEVCARARAQAILRGEPTEVRFRPGDRQLGLGGASAPPRAEAADVTDEGNTPAPRPAGSAVQWADGITLEMLDVNFIEYKELPEARVRFYPNGTSDEMTVVLRSDQNEYRKVSLECTTGLASVEVIR